MLAPFTEVIWKLCHPSNRSLSRTIAWPRWAQGRLGSSGSQVMECVCWARMVVSVPVKHLVFFSPHPLPHGVPNLNMATRHHPPLPEGLQLHGSLAALFTARGSGSKSSFLQPRLGLCRSLQNKPFMHTFGKHFL